MRTLKDYIKSLCSVYLQEGHVPKLFRLRNQAVHEPIWLYDTLSVIVLPSIPLRGHNKGSDHHLQYVVDLCLRDSNTISVWSVWSLRVSLL